MRICRCRCQLSFFIVYITRDTSSSVPRHRIHKKQRSHAGGSGKTFAEYWFFLGEQYNIVYDADRYTRRRRFPADVITHTYILSILFIGYNTVCSSRFTPLPRIAAKYCILLYTFDINYVCHHANYRCRSNLDVYIVYYTKYVLYTTFVSYD
jgi:hypothetical protein